MSAVLHTPTPWEVLEENIYSTDGYWIASAPAHFAENEGQQKANRRHIVQCVNSHDELVAALRGLLARAERELADPEDA
jgi:hypothetical protein